MPSKLVPLINPIANITFSSYTYSMLQIWDLLSLLLYSQCVEISISLESLLLQTGLSVRNYPQSPNEPNLTTLNDSLQSLLSLQGHLHIVLKVGLPLHFLPLLLLIYVLQVPRFPFSYSYTQKL